MRLLRLGPMVLALLGAATSAFAQDPTISTIDVQERVPLALLLINPKADVGGAGTADVLVAVSGVLTQHTNFQLDAIDPREVVAFCEGRLGCMVRRIRKDYERGRLLEADGTPMPYDKHLESLGKQPYPRFLVVMSVVASKSRPDRLSAVLVDTDEALAIWHEADHKRSGWEQDVEGRINSSAVVARPSWADVPDANAAKRHLDKLFRVSFRSVFEREGHWEPYGAIQITSNIDGLSIQLDGRLVGSTRAGRTRLLGVTAGGRTIVLEHPDYDPFKQIVSVEVGGRHKIDATVQSRSASAGRLGVALAGVGVFAVGAVFVGVAVAQEQDAREVVCVRSSDLDPAVCGSGNEFTTLTGADGDDPNGSGVMTAPLGYSLMGMGASWSLGSWLSPADIEIPWLALGAGVVVGALSYGLSAALNGESAYKVQTAN